MKTLPPDWKQGEGGRLDQGNGHRRAETMHNLPSIIHGDNRGAGDNSGATLKDLGVQGRLSIKRYDRACASHQRSATEAQAHAMNLGRVIFEGKMACTSTKEFGLWLRVNKLDQGSLGSQTEINACMHLYERVLLNKEFTLTGCKDCVPTNMMKWARRMNSHLFEARPAKKKHERTTLDIIVEAVRETPLDIGAGLRRELTKAEMKAFRQALLGTLS
jgi:hypothetical protein